MESNEASALSQRDAQFLLHPFTNAVKNAQEGGKVVMRGEGIYVIDEHGQKHIEALSGLWCVAVGFSEQRLIDAATRQLSVLPFYHAFVQRSHQPLIDLAEKLIGMAPVPMSKVFFTNSGSEANDTAIKLLWYWANALGKPEKKKIISRQRAYHGVTIGSASLTGMPHVHGGFDLPLDGFLHLTAPHFYREGKAGETEDAFSTRLADELDTLIQREGADTIAAMFAEPLMGAGGVIAPPSGYWKKMQAVLRKHDIPLVADEVICGFGRLGCMFGSEYYGMTPDIMILSKQLSSAYLPISALMINERIYRPVAQESERRMTFGHGFTAGGHPVAAAVALENLAVIEERGLVGRARVLGERMHARLAELAAHPLVGEVRGAGLIGAIELVASKEDKSPLEMPGKLGALASEALARRHVITRNIGDAIALCPPLIISESELDDLMQRVSAAIDDVARQVKP
ncbi:aminotransferase class III-fold pyridoxal phosphate-dependent enzyme (plasmid) [Caballeronia sp. NK8]|uniref:aspartate aminotransferase family protein n=1 Tax=Caballeronia sp. NK8 TaxID=140098 RepID=UPI001BB7AD82|nr:aspartate aminotransferase family protein [Caballeronia sp. NK8]BCQ29431.1 aminotransferase class III-fold pyridoxal phosphate-dependent enzyme [Caballeronia sp. NK8]